MKFGVKSDRGVIREINEDSFGVISKHSQAPASFIIADGMGGHNSGEVASNMAVSLVKAYIMEASDMLLNDEDIPRAIDVIMQKANVEIYNKSQSDATNSGMGTTLTVALFNSKRVFVGHVGDSRAYRIRDDKMQRITTDHSFIEEMVKNGSLTREEAENHPKKNLITRAVGCSEDMLVDTYICDLRNDDIFVLCTDGLTNMLSENEIKEVVLKYDDPQQACDELVKKANERGGSDNITVMVITEVSANSLEDNEMAG